MRPIRAACLAVAALVIGGVADAQKKPKEPKRPRMDAGRDTNAAAAYYYWGLANLERAPTSAQDAFYWASRLDPAWADPLYAQRIAFHMSNLERFWKYYKGTKYVLKSAEVRRTDSLFFRAMLRDPFLFRRLDRTLIDRLYQEMTGYSHVISSDPEMRAWFAYSDTRFGEAVAWYARAIEKDPKDYDLHAERARAFFHLTQFDSTVAEMNRALEGYRKSDEEDLVVLYESKAMYEYSIATAHIQAGKLGEAREALGRALTEDLSFYMAHQRMAALALSAGDTATALSEYELAVQLNGDDAPLRTEYGGVLVAIGKHAEAEPHLRRAIEVEPWYATPYAILGAAYEGLGKFAEAGEQYSKFMERASRNHDKRVAVQARSAALASGGAK